MKVQDPIIFRTNFENNTKWEKLCDNINTPNPEFGVEADLKFINNQQNKDAEIDHLINLLSKEYKHEFDFFFIADDITLNDDEFPIMCVNITKKDFFRVIPSEVWSVEKNLRISNMDFEEFSKNACEKGIHRGF